MAPGVCHHPTQVLLLPGTRLVVLIALGAASPLNQLSLILLLRHRRVLNWFGEEVINRSCVLLVSNTVLLCQLHEIGKCKIEGMKLYMDRARRICWIPGLVGTDPARS